MAQNPDNNGYRSFLQEIAAQMIPEEIAEAQAMADAWLKAFQAKQNN